MIQIWQNRIIAAGIAIPCQGFFFASKSKKGLHRGNRLFCLLLYAPLSAFRTSKKCNPDNLTCSRGPVLYSLVLDTCFTKCVVVIVNKGMQKTIKWSSVRKLICRLVTTSHVQKVFFHGLINGKPTCTFLLQVLTQGGIKSIVFLSFCTAPCHECVAELSHKYTFSYPCSAPLISLQERKGKASCCLCYQQADRSRKRQGWRWVCVSLWPIKGNCSVLSAGDRLPCHRLLWQALFICFSICWELGPTATGWNARLPNQGRPAGSKHILE